MHSPNFLFRISERIIGLSDRIEKTSLEEVDEAVYGIGSVSVTLW